MSEGEVKPRLMEVLSWPFMLWREMIFGCSELPTTSQPKKYPLLRRITKAIDARLHNTCNLTPVLHMLSTGEEDNEERPSINRHLHLRQLETTREYSFILQTCKPPPLLLPEAGILVILETTQPEQNQSSYKC